MKTFALVIIGATLLAPPQTFSPDADGFIRNWLILAPIVFDVSGAAAIIIPSLTMSRRLSQSRAIASSSSTRR